MTGHETSQPGPGAQRAPRPLQLSDLFLHPQTMLGHPSNISQARPSTVLTLVSPSTIPSFNHFKAQNQFAEPYWCVAIATFPRPGTRSVMVPNSYPAFWVPATNDAPSFVKLASPYMLHEKQFRVNVHCSHELFHQMKLNHFRFCGRLLAGNHTAQLY